MIKLIRAVEWMWILALGSLNYLVTMRPLVMRHVYMRKKVHLGTLLFTSVRVFLGIVIASITIWIVLKVIGKSSNLKQRYEKFRYGIVSVLTLSFMWGVFHTFLVESYGVFIFLSIWTVETILIVCFRKNVKKQELKNFDKME